jgi:ABC-2 type transport system permease protein
MKKSSKILTIIKHEYLIKVRSKSFLIATILAPIALLLVSVLPAAITMLSMESTSKKLAVLDESAYFGTLLVQSDTSRYYSTNETLAKLNKDIKSESIDGYIFISKDFLKDGKAEIVTSGGGGIGFVADIENRLNNLLKEERIKKFVSDPELAKIMEGGVNLSTKKTTEKGTQNDFAFVNVAIGYAIGFIIYFMMAIYGGMVMRGCIEEKANRIVEIIASSAKPFQIMMGKVIGIGAVGLTQMAIWGVLGLAILMAVGPMLMTQMGANIPMSPGVSPSMGLLQLTSITFLDCIGYIFFFLSGYFIYSTIYAAVGSMVDQEQDAQQFSLVVTIPLVIPILTIGTIIADPDSVISVVLSMIPFFSPVLMPVRMTVTAVPFWQMAGTILLSIGTFIVCTWFAGKIYKIGILKYGTIPTWKDLARWFKAA